MPIIFWFKVYSTTNLFSFSTMFVESLSGLEEDFVFNYIFPTMVSEQLFLKLHRYYVFMYLWLKIIFVCLIQQCLRLHISKDLV